VRIGISPLWEVAGSLAMLGRSSAPWPYGSWFHNARREVGQRRRVAELVDWFAGTSGPLPVALTPVPPHAEPALDDELKALRTASGVRLPRGGLSWFADAVGEYWNAVLAPYWPTMRAVLQTDLMRRAHTLATRGAESMASRLDDRCRWTDGALVVAGPVAGSAADVVRCTRQLVVVSLLFGRSGFRCVPGPAGVVAVSCQAPGAAVLDRSPVTVDRRTGSDPGPGDRLAILVGHTRAALLRILVMPTTTSALASTLGLSASTVSQHLSGLVAAGVVSRRRMGARVLYGLDRTGVALLGHLGGDSGRTAPAELVRLDAGPSRTGGADE
jgi:DNA-binding transcriptional ArsR family regulator